MNKVKEQLHNANLDSQISYHTSETCEIHIVPRAIALTAHSRVWSLKHLIIQPQPIATGYHKGLKKLRCIA